MRRNRNSHLNSPLPPLQSAREPWCARTRTWTRSLCVTSTSDTRPPAGLGPGNDPHKLGSAGQTEKTRGDQQGGSRDRHRVNVSAGRLSFLPGLLQKTHSYTADCHNVSLGLQRLYALLIATMPPKRGEGSRAMYLQKQIKIK